MTKHLQGPWRPVIKCTRSYPISHYFIFALFAKSGRPPKALLLTNPNNPLGITYSNSQLELIINWARCKNLHVISDEIYALSVFGDPNTFTSYATHLKNNLGDNVHIIWGMSKDFGASGLRIGVLYTQNKTLLKAISRSNDFLQVSNLAQHILGKILSNSDFISCYLKTNSELLKR